MKASQIANILASILFFWLGCRFSAVIEDQEDTPGDRASPSNNILLLEQKQTEAYFQLWLRQTQEDCSRTLKLLVGKQEASYSWVESVEHLARALQVALATERRLVVSMEDESQCSSKSRLSAGVSVYCKWLQHQLGSVCYEARRQDQQSSKKTVEAMSPASDGIIGNSSDFFNTYYYGPTPDVTLPTWPWTKTWLIDTLVWERHWGSYWVRSQLLMFLGRKLSLLAVEKGRAASQPPYIAVLLDSSVHTTLRRSFARNATKSHAWERIMAICNQYYYASLDGHSPAASLDGRTLPPPSPNLYVATRAHDDLMIIPASFLKDWNGKVFYSKSTDSDVDIIHKLKHANLLIGSFASPTFRLAASLNSLSHAATYPLSYRRVWGLDIEWIPDL